MTAWGKNEKKSTSTSKSAETIGVVGGREKLPYLQDRQILFVFGIFQKRVKAVYQGLFYGNGLLTVSPREADYRRKH